MVELVVKVMMVPVSMVILFFILFSHSVVMLGVGFRFSLRAAILTFQMLISEARPCFDVFFNIFIV